MSSFYAKFIATPQKGYTLKGGPFTKWRHPLNRVLYKKRLAAGPEPERPRSVWSNWNYDSELFAFGQRLNEKFDESLLRQAFIDPSYTFSEKDSLEKLGVQVETLSNNLDLAREGEHICKYYLRSILNFWYPKLPEEGVEAIVNYLMSREILTFICKNLGLKDLIKTKDFPIEEETMESVLFAVIAALSRSSGAIRAHLFINDFILTQLIGLDINEIWNIQNPMGLLCDQLKKRGYKSLPVSRLLWSTGVKNPTGAFVVGLYIDKQFFSKGSGESIEIAEEIAARDGLRRLFGTGEDSAPLPYGEKARQFSDKINNIYVALTKKELIDKN